LGGLDVAGGSAEGILDVLNGAVSLAAIAIASANSPGWKASQKPDWQALAF
jgi:hypothetical protein